jgi:hypothetical protein
LLQGENAAQVAFRKSRIDVQVVDLDIRCRSPFWDYPIRRIGESRGFLLDILVKRTVGFESEAAGTDHRDNRLAQRLGERCPGNVSGTSKADPGLHHTFGQVLLPETVDNSD